MAEINFQTPDSVQIMYYQIKLFSHITQGTDILKINNGIALLGLYKMVDAQQYLYSVRQYT